jgi:hypothetical protein
MNDATNTLVYNSKSKRLVNSGLWRRHMVKASGGRKSSTRRSRPSVHGEEDIDGCDFEFSESDATADAELPAARGGVQEPKKRSAKSSAKRSRQRRSS